MQRRSIPAARLLLAACTAVAAACGGSATTAPPSSTPRDSVASYAGFDIGVYPGDAALTAWKYPASPYRWVGYYLPAPCHRDTTFAGKRAFITSLGWGITAIYVGQQDWANMAAAPIAPGAAASRAVEAMAVCTASLLSSSQGAAEAADASAKLRADGFPDGTTVFLDVEHVTTISQPLLDYYRGWVAGVLADGHFKPGVYASKSNAPTFYDQSIADLHGARYTPPFWIAGSGPFTTASRPADVGLAFAQLWQGMFDAAQQYGGIRLTIDADVSTRPSPSAP